MTRASKTRASRTQKQTQARGGKETPATNAASVADQGIKHMQLVDEFVHALDTRKYLPMRVLIEGRGEGDDRG